MRVIHMSETFDDYLNGKSILITGVSGTVGKALLKYLNESKPILQFDKIIGLDLNETELFYQQNEYQSCEYIELFVCDIKNLQATKRYVSRADVVIHCAASKHVILNERSPDQALENNIVGLKNIIDLVGDTDVRDLIFTSSDKAVNPTNVMGATKLLGERLMCAAAANDVKGKRYITTRFGNVLGSNGSVVEIFRRQITEKKPLTITDKNMSRFVMSIEEAVALILKSLNLGVGGDIFVTKMHAINIDDLASAMLEINQLDVQTNKKFIGPKIGEKLFEELLTIEESMRCVELEKYFVVLPAFRNKSKTYSYSNELSRDINQAYSSQNEVLLDVNAIKDLLSSYNLI